MFKFTITFKLSNGVLCPVAYRAANKKEAIFLASNELAHIGMTNFEYVSAVEHSLV
jgi:hypothetical protein